MARESYKNMSELFLDGLYDTVAGEMHLIGCRYALVKSVNVDRGLDCLIEVKIEYPPENVRWLINPPAKIAISSHRMEEYPFYFSTIKLETDVIPYDKYEENVIFRRAFEEILRILILLV